jgi:hypothetical protein
MERELRKVQRFLGPNHIDILEPHREERRASDAPQMRSEAHDRMRREASLM